MEMEHYILFQSVESRKKTICVHLDNGAFSQAAATLNGFSDYKQIKSGHEVIYGPGCTRMGGIQ